MSYPTVKFKISKKFDKEIGVYFLNNNPDYIRYNPQLFEREKDKEFFEKVKGESNINESQIAVLDFISRNRDREIYILQGSFEENFFSFLKPYIKPCGLWWRVIADPGESFEKDSRLFDNLKNQVEEQIKKSF